MPIFEFSCQDCETRFETLVLSSSERVSCPNCQGERLQKLISAHAVGSATPAPACEAPACGGETPCGACPGVGVRS